MDLPAAQALIGGLWESSCLPALANFVGVPSQSPLFDPEWETNGLLDQSIQILVSWVRAQNVPGLTVDLVEKKGFTPVIFIEVAPTPKGADAGTVLMYGHADTQPPFVGWSEGLQPYTATRKDGKLYGRGACDDEHDRGHRLPIHGGEAGGGGGGAAGDAAWSDGAVVLLPTTARADNCCLQRPSIHSAAVV